MEVNGIGNVIHNLAEIRRIRRGCLLGICEDLSRGRTVKFSRERRKYPLVHRGRRFFFFSCALLGLTCERVVVGTRAADPPVRLELNGRVLAIR